MDSSPIDDDEYRDAMASESCEPAAAFRVSISRDDYDCSDGWVTDIAEASVVMTKTAKGKWRPCLRVSVVPWNLQIGWMH